MVLRFTKVSRQSLLHSLYGIEMSISQQVILVVTLMITSKGIAGVPGVSFVVLLATLGSVGIPVEGLAFIAGVDRIMDMARTALNVVGNALAVLVISKWEKQYDSEKLLLMKQHLNKMAFFVKPANIAGFYCYFKTRWYSSSV